MVKRKQNRYGGSRTEIWYHGTSARHLRSILAHGLQSNRKSRYTKELTALGGVYLAKSPADAFDYALDFAGDTSPPSALMVAVQVQPRTLLLDEDAMMGELDNKAIPDWLKKNPKEALAAYFEIESGIPGTRTAKAWHDYAEYISKEVRYMVIGRDARYYRRAFELAQQAFPVGLQEYITLRLKSGEWDSGLVPSAYERVYGKRAREALGEIWDDERREYNTKSMIPSWEKQHPQYRKALSIFTQLVRSGVRGYGKGRYLADIGYSKTNKIVGIWSFTPTKAKRGSGAATLILSIKYGQIPEPALRFFQDFYEKVAIAS